MIRTMSHSYVFHDNSKASEYFDRVSCCFGALFESRRDEFAEKLLISAREKSGNEACQKNITMTDVRYDKSCMKKFADVYLTVTGIGISSMPV